MTEAWQKDDYFLVTFEVSRTRIFFEAVGTLVKISLSLNSNREIKLRWSKSLKRITIDGCLKTKVPQEDIFHSCDRESKI